MFLQEELLRAQVKARGVGRPAQRGSARQSDGVREREKKPPGFYWQVALVVFVILLIGPFRYRLIDRQIARAIDQLIDRYQPMYIPTNLSTYLPYHRLVGRYIDR